MIYGMKVLALALIALIGASVAGNTYAWFTHTASVSMDDKEGGLRSGTMAIGDIGFELDVSLEKAPTKKLYPGQQGEAVYAIKNTSKTPVVFRIEGASPNAPFLSLDENAGGFTVSIYKEGQPDEALFEVEEAGNVRYYGYLGSGERKYARVRFTVAESLSELPGTAEKLSISVESCEASKKGVYSYYGLDEATFESNGFWDALLQPKPVSPAQ
jgi:hypothetical protein